MDKLLKVINSCGTLSQLRSALNYVTNYGVQNGTNEEFYQAIERVKDRVTEMTSFHWNNCLDFKAYAEHLLVTGHIKDANDFICFAELELDKLEGFKA